MSNPDYNKFENLLKASISKNLHLLLPPLSCLFLFHSRERERERGRNREKREREDE